MGKLFFVGDSITAGAWDSQGGWAGRLIGRIMAKTMQGRFEPGAFYCMPYNLGLSGNRVSDILQRLDEVSRRSVDEGKSATQIVYSIGVNDSVFSIDERRPELTEDEFRQNLTILVERSSELSNNVSFLGLLPVNDDLLNPIPWSRDKAYANEHIKRFEGIIGSVCGTYGLAFLPLFDRWAAMPDYKSLLIDGIHPNNAGHARLADEIWEFLFTDEFETFHSG